MSGRHEHLTKVWVRDTSSQTLNPPHTKSLVNPDTQGHRQFRTLTPNPAKCSTRLLHSSQSLRKNWEKGRESPRYCASTTRDDFGRGWGSEFGGFQGQYTDSHQMGSYSLTRCVSAFLAPSIKAPFLRTPSKKPFSLKKPRKTFQEPSKQVR